MTGLLSGEVLAKPIEGGTAAHLEARLIGGEMAAWDQDELLGFMRLLISREGEVGDRDCILHGNDHQ
jgi:hypothetical protein